MRCEKNGHELVNFWSCAPIDQEIQVTATCECGKNKDTIDFNDFVKFTNEYNNLNASIYNMARKFKRDHNL